MWIGSFSAVSVTLLITQELASEPPEVKMISEISAPIASATCFRASVTARFDFAPSEYWLDAFPYCSRRNGSIFSKTQSDILVVAALSA
jgi:hypothetical protein